jgi:hypothetical protein
VKKNIPRLAAALFFGQQLPLVRGSLRLRGLLTMQLPQRRLCFIYLALNISLIIIIQRLLTSPCAKLRSEQHLETRKQDLAGHALRLLFLQLPECAPAISSSLNVGKQRERELLFFNSAKAVVTFLCARQDAGELRRRKSGSESAAR